MRERIVVFGEDSATRESLARALETEGYEVVRVEDCPAAIRYFTARTTALALVDLKEDGLIAANSVNWLAQLNPELPLVILTATAELPRASTRSNLVTFLEKPVAIPALLAVLKQMIERAKRVRDSAKITQLWQTIASYGES